MAWTQTDLDTLDAAIASGQGVQEVQFADRKSKKYSIDELIKLRAEIRRGIAAASGTPRTRYGATSKGTGFGSGGGFGGWWPWSGGGR